MTVPTRHVDTRAPTSGVRPSELIKVPHAFWWLYWTTRWLCRHPWMAVAVAGALGAAVHWRSAAAGLTFVWAMLVAYVCWWLLRLRRSAGGAKLRDLPVGVAHMITLRRAWPDICRAARITAPRGTELPRLRRMTIIAGGGVRACTRLGAAVDQLERADTLAHAIGCREVTVTSPRPGWAQVECAWGDRLLREVRLTDLPRLPPPRRTGKPAGFSRRLIYGITSEGKPISVEWDKSILIGGTTRSGKSTCVWALLAALRREGIPTRLYVSDAKGGIELQELGNVLGQD
ncbi:MAG: hypothetical protein M3P18_02320, partial [Actinomycetota bacterium]|nr:hypothetical protein [Actinomycetota bacterium]